MNHPFCWSSSTIGWFLFARELASRLFVLFIVPCCYRRLQGVVLAVFGTFSYIGGQTVYTLAQTSFQILFAPAAAIGQSLPTAIIRGELSRLFDSEVQGPLFAGFAVLESISFALGSLFLQIYSLSLEFFPRLVFSISGGINIVVFVCLICFQVSWKRFMDTYRPSRLDIATTISSPDDERTSTAHCINVSINSPGDVPTKNGNG